MNTERWLGSGSPPTLRCESHVVTCTSWSQTTPAAGVVCDQLVQVTTWLSHRKVGGDPLPSQRSVFIEYLWHEVGGRGNAHWRPSGLTVVRAGCTSTETVP